ncbi:MAG: hypothetical protein LH647_03795 [Leptolyngbyaceae cyanobacterium CAN_BIN12]|nr:hypothetical protein [Leptolyngbyaceae cyanobacterium CAN_BIN12]
MTTAIAPPPIQGLKALSYPPQRGEHYLSVDLTRVDDVVKVFAVATELGFKPELVQITTRKGTTEIHALLFCEQTNGEPMASTSLDDRIDQLANEINEESIRHVYGGRLLAA